MTDKQWLRLLEIVRNRETFDVEVSLIIDSPFLPGFAGMTTKEYLTIPEKWMDANKKALERWPEVIFLPGTWVEFGLATEPTAFGAPVTWWDAKPPAALRVVESTADIARLKVPDPQKDGLLPIVLEWQRYLEPFVREWGHKTKVVCARGPMAIASQIYGVTELLMDIKIEPEAAKDLLEICTQLSIDWLQAQVDALDDVEGIEVHDDLFGMIGPEDYEEFGHPYLERIMKAFPKEWLKIMHNDNPGYKFASRFADAGAEVLNWSHLDDIGEWDAEIGDRMCLMGNIAPIEMLVDGSPEDVKNRAKEIISKSKHAFLLSAGGGVSMGTKNDNIDALVEAVKETKG